MQKKLVILETTDGNRVGINPDCVVAITEGKDGVVEVEAVKGCYLVRAADSATAPDASEDDPMIDVAGRLGFGVVSMERGGSWADIYG